MSSEQRLWWRDGVIYQIYPRSFADSNGDGIGDLNGIVDHLDYLEELGVDAIWLSPIYPSPDVDFGYDVADYKAIDPKFGTMDDFDRLTREAHRRGIRIVLDLVLNHTSDQHPWFRDSARATDSPRRDWYIWRKPRPGGGPPNNWQSVFGGPAWEFNPATGEYYYHMFYKEQPDLNWRNPAVRKEMLDVFRFWLERGVDGFRLDVFNLYFKHPEMPDNPSKLGLRGFDRQHHIHDQDQPEMMPLLAEIRALLDSYPERYAIGETFEGHDNPRRAAQYCGDGKLHAAFSFEFTKSPWRAADFLGAIQRWESALPEDAWPNYVLNNHDVPRTASRFGKGESDERLKVAAALLLTQRGTPYLYYGEEIGMRDIQVRRSEIQDPVGRRFWPFYKGRDGCRAPMQWDGSVNAGFSLKEPWLPVHPDYVTRNVAAQRGDPDSLFAFYRKLIALRKEVPVLRRGMTVPLTSDPRTVLAYLKQAGEQTALVALNFSGRALAVHLGPRLAGARWELLLSNHRTEAAQVKDQRLPLGPYEVCILLQE